MPRSSRRRIPAPSVPSRWSWPAALVALAPVALAPVALALLALSACAPQQDAASPAPESGPATDPGTSAATTGPGSSDGATFAVIGDSLTAGTAAPLRGTHVSDPVSWVPAAEQSGPTFVGGWAVPGATTAQMRAGVTGPLDADLLVVMAGTNDVNQDVPWSTSAQDLVSMVQTAAVDTVVVSAIPPYDADPAASVVYNQMLSGLATAQGWTLVDPWTTVDANGAYVAGASPDGVHPAPEVAVTVGATIAAALVAAE